MNTNGRDLCKAFRASVKLSQGELGDALDVAQSLISFWEKGTRAPTLSQALALQGFSRGAVPATVWGYTDEDIARVGAAFTSAASTADSDEHASATATSIDGTPSLAASHGREPATRECDASTSMPSSSTGRAA